MVSYLLKLDTVEKVKKFVNITRRYDFGVDVMSDRYIVDAKSILGILSLDLSNPLNIYVKNGTDNEIDNFYSEIKIFEMKNENTMPNI